MRIHYGHNQFPDRESMVAHLAKMLVIGCGTVQIHLNEDIDQDEREEFVFAVLVEMQRITGIKDGVNPYLN